MSELTDATSAHRHRLLNARFLALTEAVSDWDAPTPVAEWVARDVVEHLGWLPGMLSGMGVTVQVPEEPDPVRRLRAQGQAVQDLLDGPDADRPVETTMFGTMPLSRVIDTFYAFDLFAHAWDLAKATGQDAALDADYAAAAYQGMSAVGPALHESGQFGTPQPVAPDASPQDRLIALIGRDAGWAR